jgi:hypothetical protein
MITQTVPPAPLIFVLSLGWASFSAAMLMLSIRVEARPAAWFWTLSFVVSSVLAVVFFWSTV